MKTLSYNSYMNFEVRLLFKSNGLMCIFKKSFIRYRFQIYNRPMSLSVKVNECNTGDGFFWCTAHREGIGWPLETYVHIKHILSGTANVVLIDIQKERTVGLGMKQRGLWRSLPFWRKAESIMRLSWRHWTCGCYREIHGTGSYWRE
jgi:hypothetical protein